MAIGASTLLLAGCLLTSVGPPVGTAPLRYRDQVFAAVSVTRNAAYGSAPGVDSQPEKLLLDFYQPTGDTITKRPVIIWAHAGGFSGGNKSDDGYLVEPLVKRGYVVLAINYRLLAPGGCTGSSLTPTCIAAATGAIEDGQAAVRWARRYAAFLRLDPNRIAISGFSAGAIIATGVGLGSENVGASGNPGYSSRVRAWVSVAGGLPAGQGADATDPPGYLFSGTADTTVPYQWSVDTAHALDNAGVFAVLNSRQGAGHDLPDLTVLATQSANFYYRTLDQAHAQR